MIEGKDSLTNLETKCLSLDLIDKFSEEVVEKLSQWANEEIFSKLGGSLTTERPLKDSANAGVRYKKTTPPCPHIVIHMGMIQEIYRDCFAFPVMTEKAQLDSDAFNPKMFERFKGSIFEFKGGIPRIDYSEMSKMSKKYALTFRLGFTHDILKAPELTEDHMLIHIECLNYRFQMFELMLAWVFFHELSHAVQCHNKLKVNYQPDTMSYEINSANKGGIDSQAREILADIEGFEFVLMYMRRENINHFKSSYILLTALTCMFNRFYTGKYEESFKNILGTHPHPVIREHYVATFFHRRMMKDIPLVLEPELYRSYIYGYVYLSIKATYAGSLFWANRHLQFTGEELTSFMRMQNREKSAEAKDYAEALNESIKRQLQTIQRTHLLADSQMKQDYIQQIFK